jgi:hypothetical protein
MTEHKATPEQFKQRPNEDDLNESFDRWWRNEGSAMRPGPKEDLEEHVQRISRIAWLNGAYLALWHPSVCHALDQVRREAQ